VIVQRRRPRPSVSAPSGLARRVARTTPAATTSREATPVYAGGGAKLISQTWRSHAMAGQPQAR
jgi:hypothetical protein